MLGEDEQTLQRAEASSKPKVSTKALKVLGEGRKVVEKQEKPKTIGRKSVKHDISFSPSARNTHPT